MIRKAKISDAKQIHKILSAYSNRGTLLSRSLAELYDQLRDFYVWTNKKNTVVVGTCAMHICWEDTAEIRSLAIKRRYQKKGIGKALVQVCIKEAKQLEIKQIFVLTYVSEFFEKLGFQKVDKSILPHKVWTDCIKCIKFPDCDEEALIFKIG